MKLADVNSSLSSTIQTLEKKEEKLKNAEEELNTMHVVLSEIEEKENELTEANIKIENLENMLARPRPIWPPAEGGGSYTGNISEFILARGIFFTFGL